MTDSDPAPARAQALAGIRERIAAAARSAGRDPADVTLTAVSKQQTWAAVAAVRAAGQAVFGENRVQEAIGRWGGHREGVELRLIGPLQTNKARDAVAFFNVIETLDRAGLAQRLAREIQALGRAPRLYVQVNTGEEAQKAGVFPREADALIDLCQVSCGLRLEGLMCIPPEGEPPGPHFALLAKIARRHGLQNLSMGMSADFETAIRHGATSVRIGQALFGKREAHD